MPLYNYACEECGPFREWRAMSEAGKPVACLGCGEPAPAAVTAPYIANMNPHNRIAHQRNEKSADAPEVVRMKTGSDAQPHPHRHGAGGHGHGRPWMIGH